MEKVYIKGQITLEDVEKINKKAPVVVEVDSTLIQDAKMFSEINENCYIKLKLPEEMEQYENELEHIDIILKPKVFINLISEFEKVETSIDSDWSDLEKSTYIYAKLQDIMQVKDQDYKTIYNLTGLLDKKTNSVGMASIYNEFMKRQNIPCKYVINSDYQAWNEIQINNEYYPVDLSLDLEETLSSEVKDNNPNFSNFLVNENFYDIPRHKAINKTENKANALSKDVVFPIIDKVLKEDRSNKVMPSYEKYKIIERPKIQLKSKELSSNFENGELSKEILNEENRELKIPVSNDDIEELREDLENIGKYYPELLSKVELSNSSDAVSNNMQKIIDEIYTVQQKNLETVQEPIELTIASSNPEDFDLDFSKVPKINQNQNFEVDNKEKKYQTVVFRNTDSSKAIQLPDIREKMSPNIEALEFSGIDLSNVDVRKETGKFNVKRIILTDGKSQNISSLRGMDTIQEIKIDGINDSEFNQFMSSIYSTCTSAYEIGIYNQNLSDRKILKELSQNQVSRIEVISSNLNDLDGLEEFDGRIAFLNLQRNDLDIQDVERVEKFYKTNPYLEYYLNGNSNVLNVINPNSSRLSDESLNSLNDYYVRSGGVSRAPFSKSNAIDTMLWNQQNVPYYAKDTQLIRDELKILSNPIMVENDSEIDTIDFSQTYMQDGTMLLTLSQIEYLLNSGKTIPQDIRVKISDVSELDSQTLQDLIARVNGKGMNISGVQIIYHDNTYTQISPYDVSDYVYIRDRLDEVVSGINPSESDLDKFATVYTRLADSIAYDSSATGYKNQEETMYYAESMNNSRNLLFGLSDEAKTVCAGYADILRNALSLVGINSRLITGKTKNGVNGGGHAWNQVELKDENGESKWYYTDLTWDRKKDDTKNERSGYNYMLRGSDYFIPNGHEVIYTQDLENVEREDYDRNLVKAAYDRAKSRGLDFISEEIVIPEDPRLTYQLDRDKIKTEYARRRNDMYAKFYGDKDYENEYKERSSRFYEHTIQASNGEYDYLTIEDYPEKKEDEKFLLLDGYKGALERVSRYEAGENNIYNNSAYSYDDDKEYLETKNHTFDQHEYTQNDLATMGKYGEKVPYIPRQQGILKNIGRVVLNTGILTRNIVAPAYRFVGKYVAQPIHRLITNNKEASPYKNNRYHRMVARRDYYQDIARQRDEEETNNLRANSSDPNSIKPVNHSIRNALESRIKAIFRVSEGNEAVLRAGAADIKDNIIEQEKNAIMKDSLNRQISEYKRQISDLQNEILINPNPRNKDEVQRAIMEKRVKLNNSRSKLNRLIANGPIKSEQTDAIDDKQHSIASKEVNTMRTTAIKGFAKGLVVKYVGPKIHDWILENTKIKTNVDIPVTKTEQTKKWIDPTYKDEVVPIYEETINKAKSLKEMMSKNKNKEVTGFYSVYGGERRAATYKLTGNEKITGIFQAKGNGGNGLSDLAGLKAPTLTNGTFSNDLLTSDGILNQNISFDTLLNSLGNSSINPADLENIYVSVGDRYWSKLSDLVSPITEKVKVGEFVNKVLVEDGHYEVIDKVVNTTKTVEQLVDNPTVKGGTEMIGDILKGGIIADGIVDVAENLRNTKTDKKRNKRPNRRYDFIDEGTRNIPKSKREYDEER